MTTEWATVDADGNPIQRKTDVNGYTVVQRNGRSPTVHRLRAWNSCNTERSKSGKDTLRVVGSRELLDEALRKIGAKRGIACKRCNPYDDESDVLDETLEMGDPDIVETLDKYSDQTKPFTSEVVAQL